MWINKIDLPSLLEFSKFDSWSKNYKTLSKVVLTICKEIFKIIILKMLEDKKI